MTPAQLTELSRILVPAVLLLYAAAMVLYLNALAARARVADADDAAGTAAKRSRGTRLALTIALAGVIAHSGHIVTRSLAAGRWPLGNMFEFTTMMALVVVVAGLAYFHGVKRRPEMMGFVLLGGALTMASGLLVYSDPGPLMPILDTYWRAIHVSAIVLAAGIFTFGFIFNGLQVLRDSAERRVAARQDARAEGSTVGASYAGDTAIDEITAVPGRQSPDVTEDGDDPRGQDRGDYRRALRDAVNPWRLALFTWLATSTLSWVFVVDQPLAQGLTRFAAVNSVVALAALVGWWFVGALPPAATLDAITYRIIAFAFPIWTFGVIAGAVWAEVSWGRYWGWDPKETSAFLTWVAYAGYLHSRATRGLRGRGAGWIGLIAFGVLMFTYYAVNLVFTGLHSYAGLS